MPELLKTEPIPLIFERPMTVWQELHRSREIGGMGIGSLTWRDFHAYCAVTGERLSPGVIECVRIIDEEFHASRAVAEERRGKAREKAAKGK